jgi:polyhydroxyalkanoate synthesis regulator phasin
MSDRDKPAVATATATASPPPPPSVPGPAAPAGTAVVPPKRSPGHRGADVKDTVAEMAAKAHEISLEAGSKMAAAMKDVIGAAAGFTGLVLESARDLLQYMVRRGQMTQEEADKLMREVEASHAKKKPATPPTSHSPAKPVVARVEPAHPTQHSTQHSTHAAPVRHVTAPAKHPVKHPATAKKAPAKKATMKPAAKKPVKASTKPKAKASAKSAKKR